MAREDPTIYMRIPKDLKDALDNSAAENRRSLTAEVVARLRESLESNPATAIAHLNLELVLARLWNRRNAAQLHVTNLQTRARELEVDLKQFRAEGDSKGEERAARQLKRIYADMNDNMKELERIDKELLQAEADLAKASSEEMRHVPK